MEDLKNLNRPKDLHVTWSDPKGKHKERERESKTRPMPLKGAEEEIFPYPGKSTGKIRQNQKGASEAQRRAQ